MDPKSHLKALIVDDEAELRRSVAAVLRSSFPEHAIDIEEATNGREAVQCVRSTPFDLVLMDVRMPELDGLEALREIKSHDSRVFVVIMTAHANLEDAVQAIKEGAYDYLEKPVEPEKLQEIVEGALASRQMVSDLAISRPILDDDTDSEFIGSSEKMREIFDLIEKLARVDSTVLIRGENGTGKELVARAIHFNSPRKHGKFVAINCGAIPENLMESELFGHERGAFTGAFERKIGKFQLAHNGTIFLDEVGELQPEMQVKLLRVLQERVIVPVGGNREIKTNARVIAATNQNLEKMIELGTFREDFFYRLNVMPIFMPPLRERREDLDHLIQHFIKTCNKQFGRQVRGPSPAALQIFREYPWPGNIRELANVIERCFIMETADDITESCLPDALIQKVEDLRAEAKHLTAQIDFETFKAQAEKDFIENALKANRGRINKTVAEAGIPKNTLLRKIKKYGIDVRRFT